MGWWILSGPLIHLRMLHVIPKSTLFRHLVRLQTCIDEIKVWHSTHKITWCHKSKDQLHYWHMRVYSIDTWVKYQIKLLVNLFSNKHLNVIHKYLTYFNLWDRFLTSQVRRLNMYQSLSIVDALSWQYNDQK